MCVLVLGCHINHSSMFASMWDLVTCCTHPKWKRWRSFRETGKRPQCTAIEYVCGKLATELADEWIIDNAITLAANHAIDRCLPIIGPLLIAVVCILIVLVECWCIMFIVLGTRISTSFARLSHSHRSQVCLAARKENCKVVAIRTHNDSSIFIFILFCYQLGCRWVCMCTLHRPERGTPWHTHSHPFVVGVPGVGYTSCPFSHNHGPGSTYLFSY